MSGRNNGGGVVGKNHRGAVVCVFPVMSGRNNGGGGGCREES